MSDDTLAVYIEFLGGPKDGERREVLLVPEEVSVVLPSGSRGLYVLQRNDLDRGRDGRTLTRYLAWAGMAA